MQAKQILQPTASYVENTPKMTLWHPTLGVGVKGQISLGRVTVVERREKGLNCEAILRVESQEKKKNKALSVWPACQQPKNYMIKPGPSGLRELVLHWHHESYGQAY